MNEQIFEVLEAPDYPATCDRCGAEGTNASMKEHTCRRDFAAILNQWTDTLLAENKGAELREVALILRLGTLGQQLIAEAHATGMMDTTNRIGARETIEWQPIESAPRQSDDLLLWSDGFEIGFWREDAKAWDSYDNGWLQEPTHWMRLPKAPQK